MIVSPDEKAKNKNISYILAGVGGQKKDIIKNDILRYDSVKIPCFKNIAKIQGN
mgnify:CR=1 FL=1